MSGECARGIVWQRAQDEATNPTLTWVSVLTNGEGTRCGIEDMTRTGVS